MKAQESLEYKETHPLQAYGGDVYWTKIYTS